MRTLATWVVLLSISLGGVFCALQVFDHGRMMGSMHHDGPVSEGIALHTQLLHVVGAGVWNDAPLVATPLFPLGLFVLGSLAAVALTLSSEPLHTRRRRRRGERARMFFVALLSQGVLHPKIP